MNNVSTGSSSAFLGALGVNTHLGAAGAYSNASMTVRSLSYLGVATVRDGLAADGIAGAVEKGVAASGIKFDVVVDSNLPAQGAAGLAGFIKTLAGFEAAKPGAILAVEGLNEANIQPFSFGGDGSIAGAVAFQKALYQGVKGEASLAGKPVVNLSIAYESATAYAQAGDLSAFADAANAHAYASTIAGADGQIERSIANAAGAVGGKPVWVTETGYTTSVSHEHLGTDALSQAKLSITALLDAYENGAARTFLYELFDSNLDPSGAESERHFGLFAADGTPKPAATAIHNLTTILGYDDPAGAAPAASGGATALPADGHAAKLVKPSGAYDMVLWRDAPVWNEAAGTAAPVAPATTTVQFGGNQANVFVYDVVGGTVPVAVYHNVSSIDLALSDRPLIVSVGAASAVTAVAPVSPAQVTLTADQLVGALDPLSQAQGLHAIHLTGDRVLTLASTETMADVIAHYGDLLAKITGGYSFRIATDGPGWRQEQAFDAAGHKLATTDWQLAGTTPLSSRLVRADGSTVEDGYLNGALSSRKETGVNGVVTTSSYDTSSGALAHQIVADGNGSTATDWAGGHVVRATVAHADGSRLTTDFDASGRKLDEAAVSAKGDWTTTNFDPATGAVTTKFLSHPDGSGENWANGIIGQPYASQHQVVNASGRVDLIERFHADGSAQYRESYDADGGRSFAYFADSGQQTSLVKIAANGDKLTSRFDAGTGALVETVAQASGGTTTTSYSGGSAVRVAVVGADGTSAVTDYDGHGARTKLVEVNKAGDWATTLFDASSGAATNKFVSYAAGGGENWSFGPGGASIPLVHQVVNSMGHVTLVERKHADGSFAYIEQSSDYGDQRFSYFDDRGHQTSEVDITASGARKESVYDATGALNYVVDRHDGVTTTSVYKLGAVSQVTTSLADGSRTETDFDGTGHQTRFVQVSGGGDWTTVLYDAAGSATNKYLTHPDGSGENWQWGITGQDYVAQHQVVDKSGKVVLVERFRPDGALTHSESLSGTGVTAITDFDTHGAKARYVEINGAGDWRTTLFDAVSHQASNIYVTYHDGGGENWAYGLTGQDYTAQHQIVDGSGKVTLVERYRADGSLLVSEAYRPDGSTLVTDFDTQGHRIDDRLIDPHGQITFHSYSAADLASVAVHQLDPALMAGGGLF